MKLAVVIGHNARAQGAYSEALGLSEFEFNRDLFAHMARAAPGLGVTVREFLREDLGAYSREIDAVYDRVDAWGPDAILELHFNAGGGRGSEMLHAASSNRGRDLADDIQAQMVALRFADRGAKGRVGADRGGRSLHASRAVTVLAEPFFGDRESDCELVEAVGSQALAQAYLVGAAAWFRKERPDSLITPPAQEPPVIAPADMLSRAEALRQIQSILQRVMP